MDYATLNPATVAADVLADQAATATVELWRTTIAADVHQWCADLAACHGHPIDQVDALTDLDDQRARLDATLATCAEQGIIPAAPSVETQRQILTATISQAELEHATHAAMLLVDTDTESRRLREMMLLGSEAAHAVASARIAALPTPREPRPMTEAEHAERRRREEADWLAAQNAHLT